MKSINSFFKKKDFKKETDKQINSIIQQLNQDIAIEQRKTIIEKYFVLEHSKFYLFVMSMHQWSISIDALHMKQINLEELKCHIDWFKASLNIIKEISNTYYRDYDLAFKSLETTSCLSTDLSPNSISMVAFKLLDQMMSDEERMEYIRNSLKNATSLEILSATLTVWAKNLAESELVIAESRLAKHVHGANVKVKSEEEEFSNSEMYLKDIKASQKQIDALNKTVLPLERTVTLSRMRLQSTLSLLKRDCEENKIDFNMHFGTVAKYYFHEDNQNVGQLSMQN